LNTDEDIFATNPICDAPGAIAFSPLLHSRRLRRVLSGGNKRGFKAISLKTHKTRATICPRYQQQQLQQTTILRLPTTAMMMMMRVVKEQQRRTRGTKRSI
jgi:hypothetical protein